MRITTPLLASLVLAAGSASAADTGFYFGAGMGYSNLSIDEGKIDRMIDTALEDTVWSVDKSKTDQNATPYSIFVGYRLLPWLAAEVAYMDLGSASYRGYISDNTNREGSVKGTWSVDGWPLSVLGIWPVSDTWEVFGRVGVFMGDVKLVARALDNTGKVIVDPDGDPIRGNVSDSTTEFFGGVGVQMNFMEHLTGRAEWQAMPSVGNNDTGSGDFNNFLFSLIYRF